MIAYLKGEIVEILEDRVILEAGNIGYNLFMPMAGVDGVLRTGDETKIYTYLNVRRMPCSCMVFLPKTI